MRYYFFIGAIIMGLIFNITAGFSQSEFSGQTITFKSLDGIDITADLYDNVETDKDVSPIILLFHQARFSRGEYREIAPKLNAMGYTCISIDQRSGDEVNEVKNETHLRATSKGLPTKYPDAYQDLQATLNYAVSEFPNRKIIVWGSSYSASLVFILAQKNPDLIAGVVSFSPGEYFKLEGKTIKEFAEGVKCPVFVTSAKNEHDSWAEIFKVLPAHNNQSFLPKGEGFHGSKALWEAHEGNQDYWDALVAFLESLR
tara:strand:+ start:14352 stop:15122 length:771 start_codon:yes stop_codon:yes gene_type:complete